MATQKAVETTAPTRIDLAGGTLDIWPLYLFHDDAVTVNAAINLRARVRLLRVRASRVRLTDLQGGRSVFLAPAGGQPQRQAYPLFRLALQHFGLSGGLEIAFSSGVPRGAGLAGSSALMVALCEGLLRLKGQRLQRARFLDLVRDLETRLIRVPAGLQDYFPAIWGGVQALWWGPGGVARERLAVEPGELEKRLLLVYTGRPRQSGVNNWAVCKRHLDGSRTVQRGLSRIARASGEMAAALRRADFEAAGAAMAEEYRARKGLFPGIATREIDTLERLAKKEGAQALKVCGAGGGGCVVVYADPACKDRLRRAIEKAGLQQLPFRLSRTGIHTC